MKFWLTEIKTFTKPVLKIGSIEIILYVIQFASLALKFRILQLELMGAIGYFTAIGEIPSIFYSHFNRTITRFFPSSNLDDKSKIFTIVLAFQFVVILIFIFYILAGQVLPHTINFWSGKKSVEGISFRHVSIFLGVYAFSIMLQRLMQAYTMGMGKLLYAQMADLTSNLIGLSLLLILWFDSVDKQLGVTLILSFQAGIPLITAGALLFIGVRSKDLPMAKIFQNLINWKSECQPMVRKKIWNYTLPLQAAAVFAYLKENLAILVLGQANYLSNAGVYQLVTRIYLVPRKFIPGLMEKLAPKLVKVLNRDKVEFYNRYNTFCNYQFLAYAAVSTLIMTSTPAIIWIFKIQTNQVYWLLLLFSMNLLFSSIAQMNINIIMLGESTINFLYTSIARSIVVVILTTVLVSKYQMLGAGAALLSSSIFVAALLAIETKGTDLFDWKKNLRHTSLIPLILMIWLLPIIFKAKYYLWK